MISLLGFKLTKSIVSAKYKPNRKRFVVDFASYPAGFRTLTLIIINHHYLNTGLCFWREKYDCMGILYHLCV